MPPSITLVVPTLNRGRDLLLKCLESFAAGSRQPDQTIVIDNGQQNLAEQNLAGTLPFLPQLAIYEPGENLGFAASCNWALRYCALGDSLWLNSNDDLTVAPELLENLANSVDIFPDIPFYFPESGAGRKFTLFLARPRVLLENVGEFDEQFWPAYFEDNDYARRFALAGLEDKMVPGAEYLHETSSTLAAYTPEQREQHHLQFGANRQRYADKWGGPPGAELWTVPGGQRG